MNNDFDFSTFLPPKTVHPTPHDDTPKKAAGFKLKPVAQSEPQAIELYQWQDSHFYKVNGEFYPSVTTILSVIRMQFLEDWRGRVGNDEAQMVLKRTSEDGSAAHNIFSRMVTEGRRAVYGLDPDPLRDVTVPNQFVHLAVHKLTQFWEMVKPRLLHSEVKIFSPRYSYAGTVDLIIQIEPGAYQIAGSKEVWLPGGIWVADIKTGKNISETAGLQIAAYAKAIEETMGIDVVGTMILHTQAQTKSGIEGFTVKIWDRHEIEEQFEIFQAAQRIYDWKKPYKPKELEIPRVISLNNNQ